MQRSLITILILAALAMAGCYPVLDTSIPANQAIVEARRTPAPAIVPVEEVPTVEPCTVKGNVSASGEKIAHVEGQANYTNVVIDPEHGEKCFPTLDAAIAEGWRSAQR